MAATTTDPGSLTRLGRVGPRSHIDHLAAPQKRLSGSPSSTLTLTDPSRAHYSNSLSRFEQLNHSSKSKYAAFDIASPTSGTPSGQATRVTQAPGPSSSTSPNTSSSSHPALATRRPRWRPHTHTRDIARKSERGGATRRPIARLTSPRPVPPSPPPLVRPPPFTSVPAPNPGPPFPPPSANPSPPLGPTLALPVPTNGRRLTVYRGVWGPLRVPPLGGDHPPT